MSGTIVVRSGATLSAAATISAGPNPMPSILDATSDAYWDNFGFSAIWTGSAWQMTNDDTGLSFWTVNMTLGWQTGFRPTSVDFTYTNAGPGDGFSFHMEDTLGGVLGDVSGITNGPGQHTVNLPLTFLLTDIGGLPAMRVGYPTANGGSDTLDAVIFNIP